MASKKKRISDYNPKGPETETIIVQAHVEKALHAKVHEKIKANKGNWNSFITHCFEAYLSEDESKA